MANIQWFVILLTDTHSRGMFDLMRRGHRFVRRVTAAGMLMTDVYPKFR